MCVYVWRGIIQREKKGFYGSSFMIKRSVFFPSFIIFIFIIYTFYLHISSKRKREYDKKNNMISFAFKFSRKIELEKRGSRRRGRSCVREMMKKT